MTALLARRVADLYLPPPSTSAQSEIAAAADAVGVDVSSRAGLFFDERTGEPMRLVVSDGRLRIANGPPLIALAQDRFRPPRPDPFFRSQADVVLTFSSDDRVDLESKDGQKTRYRRAQPWTPTAAGLQAVDGRYESEELGSIIEILPGTHGLVMRMERAPDKSLELTPVERDTYMLRMMIVRFRRDGSGKVTGFDYGNPVVRNISFTRLGARSAVRDTSIAQMPARKQPAAAATSDTAAPPLERLSGEYELAPGRTLAITLESGRLHGQPPGGEKRALTHVAGTTFSADGSPVKLTFTLGANGRATSAVCDRRDASVPCRRCGDDAPDPVLTRHSAQVRSLDSLWLVGAVAPHLTSVLPRAASPSAPSRPGLVRGSRGGTMDRLPLGCAVAPASGRPDRAVR